MSIKKQVFVKRYEIFEPAKVISEWHWAELTMLIVKYVIDKKKILVHPENVFLLEDIE